MTFQIRALLTAILLSISIACSGGGSGGGGNPVAPVSGRFEINSPSRSEGDNGQTQFDFVVTLSTAQTDTVKVIAGTRDLSAVSISGGFGSSDFTSLSNVELVFLPGELNKVISVFANADLIDEGDEEFQLELSNPQRDAGQGFTSDATLQISGPPGIGTILDDDSSQFQIDDVSADEGTINSRSLNFTISLTTSSQKTVEVTAETLNGTATIADGDYNANSQTLIFPPGTTTMSFTVNVNRDDKVELDEQLTVNLRGAVGATILDASGRGVIRNDDVSIDIADATVLEGSSGTQIVNIPITIAQSLSRDLRFTVNSSDNSAVSSGTNLVPSHLSKLVLFGRVLV